MIIKSEYIRIVNNVMIIHPYFNQKILNNKCIKNTLTIFDFFCETNSLIYITFVHFDGIKIAFI